MGNINRLFSQENIHAAFEIGLGFKAVFTLLEILAGILAYLVPQQFLLHVVLAITHTELIAHPQNLIANYLLHVAQNLSLSSQHFTAVYLLGHGVVKLWLIVGLWRERLGYYPFAIVVFSLFIAYQMYRYSFTHSVVLLLLTVVDLVVIGLTWLEYRHLQRRASV